MGKKQKPTAQNISIFRNGIYYHLLRFAFVGNDAYVHPISSSKEIIKASDGINIYYKKLPDHISYHKDGKVHIKFKDGTYHDVPFRLPENFISYEKLLDLPWIAISYYDEGFDFHKDYFKTSAFRPKDHVIFKSHNISFTIIMHLRDLGVRPLQNRVIHFEVRVGSVIPEKPYPNLLKQEGKIKKMVPALNVCLNPDDAYLNDLRLFSEMEVQNSHKFFKDLSRSFPKRNYL